MGAYVRFLAGFSASAGHLSSYLISLEQEPKLYQWIDKCLVQGERVYWVCPTIEEEGVLSRHAQLMKRFPDQVGYLHGKMSSADKEKAMASFREGRKPVLVVPP